MMIRPHTITRLKMTSSAGTMMSISIVALPPSGRAPVEERLLRRRVIEIIRE